MTYYNQPRILNENVSTVSFNVNDYKGTNTDVFNVLQNDNRYLQIYDYPRITVFNIPILTPIVLTNDDTYTTPYFDFYPKFTSSILDITTIFNDVILTTVAEGIHKLSGTQTLIVNDVIYEDRIFGVARFAGQRIIANNNYYYTHENESDILRFQIRMHRNSIDSANNVNMTIDTKIQYKITEFKNI